MRPNVLLPLLQLETGDYQSPNIHGNPPKHCVTAPWWWTKLSEMPICNSSMVKRHLLTLFVLLSGLAALQAPVHASAAATVAAQSRAITCGGEAVEASHELCAFVAEARAEATGRVSDTLPSFGVLPSPSLAAPYIFGVERALE
jgi:hypothetical protein